MKQPTPTPDIALFHDYFAIRGGGERLVLVLARELDGCTLVHGYRTQDSYDGEAFPERSVSLDLPSPFRRSGLRVMALAAAFTRRRGWAASVPVRIFSGVAAPFAAPEKGKGGVNIFYCHTPPRFLFDQRDHFLAGQGAVRGLAAGVAMRRFEKGYRAAVRRMDVVVANSENTRARISRYLGRDSVVVPPPVDTDEFSWGGQGDYFLSTARLTPLKQVDRIVDAFLEMPDRKLVVVSGGEELEVLKRRAAGAPNITFRGWVDDAELRALVGNAIATIYLPRDEDFGMSPVESMAAGKPVIGVAEGGLLETVLPDETGVLLPPDFSNDQLKLAVAAMTPQRAAALRAACEARAQAFTREKFVAGMKAVIEEALRQAAHKA